MKEVLSLWNFQSNLIPNVLDQDKGSKGDACLCGVIAVYDVRTEQEFVAIESSMSLLPIISCSHNDIFSVGRGGSDSNFSDLLVRTPQPKRVLVAASIRSKSKFLENILMYARVAVKHNILVELHIDDLETTAEVLQLLISSGVTVTYAPYQRPVCRINTAREVKICEIELSRLDLAYFTHDANYDLYVSHSSILDGAKDVPPADGNMKGAELLKYLRLFCQESFEVEKVKKSLGYENLFETYWISDSIFESRSTTTASYNDNRISFLPGHVLVTSGSYLPTFTYAVRLNKMEWLYIKHLFEFMHCVAKNGRDHAGQTLSVPLGAQNCSNILISLKSCTHISLVNTCFNDINCTTLWVDLIVSYNLELKVDVNNLYVDQDVTIFKSLLSDVDITYEWISQQIHKFSSPTWPVRSSNASSVVMANGSKLVMSTTVKVFRLVVWISQGAQYCQALIQSLLSHLHPSFDIQFVVIQAVNFSHHTNRTAEEITRDLHETYLAPDVVIFGVLDASLGDGGVCVLSSTAHEKNSEYVKWPDKCRQYVTDMFVLSKAKLLILINGEPLVFNNTTMLSSQISLQGGDSNSDVVSILSNRKCSVILFNSHSQIDLLSSDTVFVNETFEVDFQSFVYPVVYVLYLPNFVTAFAEMYQSIVNREFERNIEDMDYFKNSTTLLYTDEYSPWMLIGRVISDVVPLSTVDSIPSNSIGKASTVSSISGMSSSPMKLIRKSLIDNAKIFEVNKVHDIAYLYYRCDRRNREELFDKIYMAYRGVIGITPLGACRGNNMKEISPPTYSSNMANANSRFSNKYLQEAIEMYKPYKFVVAYENSVIPGYITEKVLTAYLASSIPIYFGTSTVHEIFNNESMIFCNDFQSLEDCIDYIVHVNNHYDVYSKMVSANPFKNISQFCGSFFWNVIGHHSRYEILNDLCTPSKVVIGNNYNNAAKGFGSKYKDGDINSSYVTHQDKILMKLKYLFTRTYFQ